MSSCVIMQPTYLPWAGYFNLISMADSFVFYDDAEFSKGSWHNRNRLVSNGDECWLTIPVSHKLHQKISDVMPVYAASWNKKHVKTITNIYSKHPFFSDLAPILDLLIKFNATSLADINIEIIKLFMQILDIDCAVYRSSHLSVAGSRSVKVLEMCKKLGCEKYISPLGSRDYIIEDGVLLESGIDVVYQSFTVKPYAQKTEKFIPYMSIIDVIASIGKEECKNYIRG